MTLRDGGFVSIMNAEAPLAPRSEVAGTHRPEGILVACGPDIPNGVRIDDVSILDIAPIVLTWHGIRPPASLEGRVPAGLTGWGRHVALATVDAAARGHLPVVAGDTEPDADEAVLHRLRSLGYIE